MAAAFIEKTLTSTTALDPRTTVGCAHAMATPTTPIGGMMAAAIMTPTSDVRPLVERLTAPAMPAQSATATSRNVGDVWLLVARLDWMFTAELGTANAFTNSANATALASATRRPVIWYFVLSTKRLSS